MQASLLNRALLSVLFVLHIHTPSGFYAQNYFNSLELSSGASREKNKRKRNLRAVCNCVTHTKRKQDASTCSLPADGTTTEEQHQQATAAAADRQMDKRGRRGRDSERNIYMHVRREVQECNGTGGNTALPF